jgi:hypothetical protein
MQSVCKQVNLHKLITAVKPHYTTSGGYGRCRELFGMTLSGCSERPPGKSGYLAGIPSSYQPEVSVEGLCTHKNSLTGGKYILTRKIRWLPQVHTLYAVRKTSSKYRGISCLSTDGGDLSTAAVDKLLLRR